MPRGNNQCYEIADDENGVLEKHVKTRHNRVLNLLNITTHAGDDVTFALFTEETKRQGIDFLIELIADIAHNSGADRDNRGRREEISSGFQHGHESQKYADNKQCIGLSCRYYEVLNVVVGIVGQHFYHAFYTMHIVPSDEFRDRFYITCLKQNLQNRNQCHERKDIQHR